jgi:hypothetical protein
MVAGWRSTVGPVVLGRAGAPDGVEDVEELLLPFGEVALGDAERVELVGGPAEAEADRETSVAQDVDRRERAGEGHRPVPRRHEDARAEADPVGAGGDVREGAEGVEHGGLLGRQRAVGGRRVRDTGRDGGEQPIHDPDRVVAERLCGPSRGPHGCRLRLPAGLGELDADLHGGPPRVEQGWVTPLSQGALDAP